MKTRSVTLSFPQLVALRKFVKTWEANALLGKFQKIVEAAPTKAAAPMLMTRCALENEFRLEPLTEALTVWAFQIGRNPQTKALMQQEVYDSFMQVLAMDLSGPAMSEEEKFVKETLLKDQAGLQKAFKEAEVVDWDEQLGFAKSTTKPPPTYMN